MRVKDFVQGTIPTHASGGVLQWRTRGIYPKREAHARGRIIEYGLYIYILLLFDIMTGKWPWAVTDYHDNG